MNKLGIFIKKYGTTVLTALGVGGVVATAIVSSYDTKRYLENYKKPDNKKEQAKQIAKNYWPTAITIVGTSACVIFSHTLDAKKIAVLTTAITALEEKFRKYRKIITEKLGEEEEHNIYAQVVDVKDTWYTSPGLPESDNGELVYFYDEFSEKFFRATTERVQQAIYHLNRNFQLRGHAYLSEFYEFLGFEDELITDLSKMIGWSDTYYLEEMGLTPWVDLYFEEKTASNGVTYYTIIYDLEPCLGAMKDWQ